MENFRKTEHTILTSLCDAQGKLSVSRLFDLFMDMAADHAARLGVGYYDMLERRCYWVAVRTRVRIHRRPRLGETITAETWPGKPGLAKSDRFYRLAAGEELLAEGRTEWGAQDIDTGAVRRTDSFGFPMDLDFREERLCPEPFTRFRDGDFSDGGDVCRYTVRSTDIDVGRHMNNVAYIRMLLGTFSTEEQEAMDISEVEISYRRGCFEGEELQIVRRRTEDGWQFLVRRPDGETAAHAAMRLR